MSSPFFCSKTVFRQGSDIHSRLLQYANRTRNKGYFEDITVGVGKCTFSANRMVLSCFSTFFEENFQVNEAFHKSVSIKDVDEDSFRSVIDFIYSAEITINQDNVINLLKTGHKLKMDELNEFCFDYLKSVVNSQNCFYILDAINLYQNETLKSIVYLCMGKNVDTIIQSLEFKKLSKQNVIEFLSKLIEYQFGNATLQFEAMVNWIKYSENERSVEFPDLFQLLNIDEIPNHFLTNVVSRESLVQTHFVCSKLVMEKLAEIVEETKSKFNKSSVICIGGDQTSSKVVEEYNLSGKAAKEFPDLPVKLDSFCALKLENTIVCIGGDTNSKWNITNQVWIMDLMKDYLQWKEIAPMKEKRCLFGATVYHDSLVVAGGDDGKNYLRSAEIYKKKSNHWEIITPLNEARRSLALVAWECCLYALGGFNGENVFSSVERLCGLDDEWKFIPSMNSPRYVLAAVTCQNKIFAIGGRLTNSNSSALKTVEMFDHSKQKWIYVESMNVERWGHSACTIGDRIFVIGGRNKDYKHVREIESYDVVRDEWKIVANTDAEWGQHSIVAL